MSEDQSGWKKALKAVGIGLASVAALGVAAAIVVFGFIFLACSGVCK